VFGFIGRVEPKQKGIDLIIDWLSTFSNQPSTINHQFILLGTGDPEWENKLKELVKGNETWLSINLTFSEELAHKIYAGCDFIVVPSKFEPCGLPQMIAQRYGTLPVVHAVGGLKDTVKDGWTGFSFEEYSAEALAEKVDQALKTAGTDAYWKMAQAAMQQDFSWPSSAKKYIDLYNKAIKLKQA
jgi:starch synthase